VILIPVVFAVLFALALFGPISNLAALPPVYEAYGIGDAVPWPLLILTVVLPVMLYLAGLMLGRGRPPFERALILTVALAASFALYFGLVSLVGAIQPPIPL
jgi:hypothetical protein